MNSVLALLLINAVLGAVDTIGYHEFGARLATRIETTRLELQLHAGRDAVYVVVYGTLAWFRPSGWLAVALAVLLLCEIAITLVDFVVEDRDRPAIGGIAAGERVLHTLMAIVYGAMLSRLIPVLLDAVGESTSLTLHDAPLWMSIGGTLAAVGIAGSGIRDWLATRGRGCGLIAHPDDVSMRTTPIG